MAPHTMLSSPAFTEGLLVWFGKGRNSHGSDFSLFSTRCTGCRRIHLAVGDHFGALLRLDLTEGAVHGHALRSCLHGHAHR